MLIATVTKYVEKLNLEKALQSLKLDISNEEKRIQEIEGKAQKEFNDVEILKVTSLPKLILKTIGSLDGQLSKEEQELQNIQTKYINALNALDILESEKKRVTTEFRKRKGVEKSLLRLTGAKAPDEDDYLNTLAYKIVQSYSQSQRFEKAIDLGKQAGKDLNEAILILSKSKEFILAEFDSLSPKTQYDLFNKALNSLKSFNRELKIKHPTVSKIKNQKKYQDIKSLNSTRRLLISNERYLEKSRKRELRGAIKTVKTHFNLVQKQIEMLFAQQKEALFAHEKAINEWESFNLPFE